MRSLILVLLMTQFCSCNMTAQNYYPDKIGDTALYYGELKYKDDYGNHRVFQDSVYVIRTRKDTIEISFTDILLITNAVDFCKPIKRISQQFFLIDNSKKYYCSDSLRFAHWNFAFDFTHNSELTVKYKRVEILGKGDYKSITNYLYEFSGEKSFYR